MDIKIETIYGNVNLISGYDCDSSSYFYDSYDDSGNYLGALWNLPYYDKDDDELIERMKIMIESAIEINDICIPSYEEKGEDLIYLITILEYANGCVTAESYAYDSMDKCMEVKTIRVNEFIEKCDEHKLKYKVNDSDVICEIMTENKSNYLCITMKSTIVM